MKQPIKNPDFNPKLRPATLYEVSLRGRENIDNHLREFLDSFYLADNDEIRISMLSEEPIVFEDDKANAYLGAVAEHLSYMIRKTPPEWVHEANRFLHRAWFPCGLESLKATLIKESPSAFRRRMIFVGLEPLYRPRKATAIENGKWNVN